MTDSKRDKYREWDALAVAAISDQDAVAELCEKILPKAQAIASSMYCERGLAVEDMAYEAVTHLWHRLPIFDPSRGSFAVFANRVMKNFVIAANRKHMSRSEKCAVFSDYRWEGDSSFASITDRLIDSRFTERVVGSSEILCLPWPGGFEKAANFGDLEDRSRMLGNLANALRPGYFLLCLAKYLKPVPVSLKCIPNNDTTVRCWKKRARAIATVVLGRPGYNFVPDFTSRRMRNLNRRYWMEWADFLLYCSEQAFSNQIIDKLEIGRVALAQQGTYVKSAWREFKVTLERYDWVAPDYRGAWWSLDYSARHATVTGAYPESCFNPGAVVLSPVERDLLAGERDRRIALDLDRSS